MCVYTLATNLFVYGRSALETIKYQFFSSGEYTWKKGEMQLLKIDRNCICI